MSVISEPLGRVLGNRYRLVAALGSGASAQVFLAEDMVLQRRVAVKVLQPALAKDEAFLRRFRAEARSVAALNHPHVLRVFDWGEGDDGPYLVLEYLEGGSLFDMLARGRRLSPAQAARMGAQAADGLAYAHARGIVHRDVKPANILFDEDGRVRVADFGVARALSSASTTDPGTMLGTARYASPEQAQGHPLDGRSDVYSLGLVLYEAVTGTVPFSGETPHATLQARIGEDLPADPALGPLGPLLGAACAPDLQARPDAGVLAGRLDALAETLSPGGPLPLVRRAPIDDDALGTGGTDLTLAEAAGATLVGDAALTLALTQSVSGGGTGADLAASGEPTATIPATTGASYRGPQPTRRGAGRRRWPWVVAILVVVACLLAAGAVYVEKAKLLTPKYAVPSVIGDTLATARQALGADHFKVEVGTSVQSIKVAAGKVLRQFPPQGTSLASGSVVHLVPSAGPPSVNVPSLTGAGNVTCPLARQLLAQSHLRANCPALSAYTKTVPQGDVINWSYAGKIDPTTAPYGAVIDVAISEGKPPVQVPTLSGQSWTQANATLSADGLVVKEVQAYSTSVSSNDVISTTPGPGATVPWGSPITVTVSKGSQYVAVPNVIGDTVAKATAAIQAANLTVGPVYGPATGVVFTTDPLAGQKEKIGTPIALYTETPPPTGNGPKPKTGTAPPAGG